MTQSMRDRILQAAFNELDAQAEKDTIYAAMRHTTDGAKIATLHGDFDLTKMVDAILSELERPSEGMFDVGLAWHGMGGPDETFTAMIRAIREGA